MCCVTRSLVPFRRLTFIRFLSSLRLRWEEGVPGPAPRPEFFHANVQPVVSQSEEHPFHHLPELDQRDAQRPRQLGQEGGVDVAVVVGVVRAPKGLGGDHQRREAQPVDRPRGAKRAGGDRTHAVVEVAGPGRLHRAGTVQIDHGQEQKDLGSFLLNSQQFVQNVLEVRQEIGAPITGPGPQLLGIAVRWFGIGSVPVAGVDRGGVSCFPGR